MRYQVVARVGAPAGRWDYYPYWSPIDSEAAAERLATYAAQSGREATILYAPSDDVLEALARAVVEDQNESHIPALRYLPGAESAVLGDQAGYQVEKAFHTGGDLDPYREGPGKSEMDIRRFRLEMGQGGDVLAEDRLRHHRLTLPQSTSVLAAWLELQTRVAFGTIGGPLDGAQNRIAEGQDGAA